MTLKHYSSNEAVERREAGLTDRLEADEFIRLCQEGEGDFMTIDLEGADLKGIRLKESATLYGSNLSGVDLSQSILVRCTLNETDLSHAILNAADLRNSYFDRANLRQACLEGANLGEAEFNGADLQEAVLSGANLEKAKLNEADLTRANLEGARLEGTSFRWANLSQARLDDTDLGSADLSGAIMPDGLRSGAAIAAEADTLSDAQAQLKAQIPEGSILIAERVVSDGQPVIRSRQTFEAEAPSLEETRDKIKAQIPAEYELLAEKVLAGANPETVSTTAMSTDSAFEIAQGKLPGNVTVLEKKEIASPKRGVVSVEAPDENTARLRAQAQGKQTLGSLASIENVKLVKAGSKGVLGLGAKPNQYEVEMCAPARVEIIYQPIVKMACEFGLVERPKAKVIGRTSTLKQELDLLQEALISGGMAASPLLWLGFRMAYNILAQSPESLMSVMIEFYRADLTIIPGLNGMISNKDYPSAELALDEYHKFLSLLASHVKNHPEEDDFILEFCAGSLGSTLCSRYAQIVEATGEFETAVKAVECSEQGLALMPTEGTIRNASRSHRMLAGFFIERENWKQAIAQLERAVQIDPQYDNAWWLLSQIYIEENEIEKSIQCCVRAADLGHPKAVETLASFARRRRN